MAAGALARWATPTRVLLAASVVPPAAVGIALFTQHGLGMQPCPWCVLQRAIFLAIAIVSLLGLAAQRLSSTTLLRRALALPMLALALCGVAAALYQHFVAAASTSCNLSLAERIVRESGLAEWLPDVFEPMASCADAAATLLGVPYEFYSLTLFVLLSAAAVWLLLRGDTVRR